MRQDKGKMRLEVRDQFSVGRQQFARFSLCQGNIQAVVNTDPHRRRDGDGPWNERPGLYETRRRRHDVGPQNSRLTYGDLSLSLRPREGMGDLDLEDGGAQELMNRLLEVVAKLPRFG